MLPHFQYNETDLATLIKCVQSNLPDASVVNATIESYQGYINDLRETGSPDIQKFENTIDLMHGLLFHNESEACYTGGLEVINYPEVSTVLVSTTKKSIIDWSEWF